MGLTFGSVPAFAWRCGVLTRLMFDPVDIFLYGSKFYQGFYDQGRGHFSVVAFLYVSNNVIWGGLRVVLYGWFCVSITMMVLQHYQTFNGFVSAMLCALLLGSWVMWALQVLWMFALAAATKNCLK